MTPCPLSAYLHRAVSAAAAAMPAHARTAGPRRPTVNVQGSQMHLNARLLGAAIAAALAFSASAQAAMPDTSPATRRALGLIEGHAAAARAY